MDSMLLIILLAALAVFVLVAVAVWWNDCGLDVCYIKKRRGHCDDTLDHHHDVHHTVPYHPYPHPYHPYPHPYHPYPHPHQHLIPGPQGPQGVAGPQGPQGVAGPQGPPGAVVCAPTTAFAGCGPLVTSGPTGASVYQGVYGGYGCGDVSYGSIYIDGYQNDVLYYTLNSSFLPFGGAATDSADVKTVSKKRRFTLKDGGAEKFITKMAKDTTIVPNEKLVKTFGAVGSKILKIREALAARASEGEISTKSIDFQNVYNFDEAKGGYFTSLLFGFNFNLTPYQFGSLFTKRYIGIPMRTNQKLTSLTPVDGNEIYNELLKNVFYYWWYDDGFYSPIDTDLDLYKLGTKTKDFEFAIEDSVDLSQVQMAIANDYQNSTYNVDMEKYYYNKLTVTYTGTRAKRFNVSYGMNVSPDRYDYSYSDQEQYPALSDVRIAVEKASGGDGYAEIPASVIYRPGELPVHTTTGVDKVNVVENPIVVNTDTQDIIDNTNVPDSTTFVTGIIQTPVTVVRYVYTYEYPGVAEMKGTFMVDLLPGDKMRFAVYASIYNSYEGETTDGPYEYLNVNGFKFNITSATDL